MTLDIPPGATVQIFIGGQPMPYAAFPASGEAPALAASAAPVRGRPLLKFVCVGVLMTGAFLGGRAIHPGSQTSVAAAGALSAPRAYAAPPIAPEAYERALPDRTPPAPSAETGSQIPSAFVQKLQQPPTITPAPGTNSAAPPGPAAAGAPLAKHPFGLED